MFRIRKEQMEAFSSSRRAQFERRVFEQLHKAFPIHCSAMGEGFIRELVTKMTDEAGKYGIVTQRATYKFICLGVIAGPEIHLAPAVQNVLNDISLSPDERVDQLYSDTKEFLKNTQSTTEAN